VLWAPSRGKPNTVAASSDGGGTTHSDVSEYYGKVVKQTTDLQTSACIMEVQKDHNSRAKQKVLLWYCTMLHSLHGAPFCWPALCWPAELAILCRRP